MKSKSCARLKRWSNCRPFWSIHQRDPESDIDFYSFIVKIRPEIIRPHVIVVLQAGKPVALVAARIETAGRTCGSATRFFGGPKSGGWRFSTAVSWRQTNPEVSELVVGNYCGRCGKRKPIAFVERHPAQFRFEQIAESCSQLALPRLP